MAAGGGRFWKPSFSCSVLLRSWKALANFSHSADWAAAGAAAKAVQSATRAPREGGERVRRECEQHHLEKPDNK